MKLPLAKTTVPPTSSLNTNFILVGEQPGRTEVRNRKIFSGPAGDELNLCLNAAGIGRPFCYITNVIKSLDHPIEDYIRIYKNTRLLNPPIISPQGEEYIKFLQWELSQIPTKYIGAIGAVALYALTGTVRITKQRGSLLDCTLIPGRKVIPIIHPATVIPPKRQFLNRMLIIFDLKRLRNYQVGLTTPTEREIIVKPTFLEVLKFLAFCKEKGLQGDRISYDIEVFMNRVHKTVSCIAFAVNKTALCIPFTDNNGDYFTIDQEKDIWLKIADILSDPNIKSCGQNLCFDGHFLLRTYGIVNENVDDTMIAQSLLMPDFPKGLDFITSILTDHAYYKDDGKAFFKGIGVYEKFWRYNATDALICDEVISKQLEGISSMNNMHIYKQTVDLVQPLIFMMEHGIKIDIEKMYLTNENYKQEIEKNQKELDKIAGFALNANSHKQLKEYFINKLKLPAFKNKGSITFNNDAIKRYIRRGIKEATYIQNIRKFTKLRSTYLDIGKIDNDGRYRCSYNPVGTSFSRISSSANIWGSGGNLQNIPHHIQTMFIVDPDYVYYSFDLSQAENRIVAYVGGISNMIECFETNKDVHAKTAKMIMRIFYGIEDLGEKTVLDMAPIGDKTKNWRFWGKKANHGFNYGLGYKNFSLLNELSEDEGKLVYNAYHDLYQGVKRTYHNYVKNELRNHRRLINLMQRSTPFLGPITGLDAEETFKKAYSCIPQGTVGDIINKQGVNYIYYNQEFFKDVILLCQIHDEIGFEIPLKLSWKEHADKLIKIKKSLEISLTTHNNLTFIIPVDLTMGKNLNKEVGIEIDLNKDLVQELEKGWNKLEGV